MQMNDMNIGDKTYLIILTRMMVIDFTIYITSQILQPLGGRQYFGECLTEKEKTTQLLMRWKMAQEQR